MMTHEDYGRFVVHENDRHVAFNDLCSDLRRHNLQNNTSAWPTVVLPHIADVLYADGAGFISAGDDGTLEILQGCAARPGHACTVEQGRVKGGAWAFCRSPHEWTQDRCEAVNESRATDATLVELGIRLPVGSSVMLHPMPSVYRPASCIGVWRCPQGGRSYSLESFRGWDLQWLRLSSEVVGTSIDLREHTQRALRARCIQRSMQAVLDAVAPTVLGLHVVAESTPTECRVKVQEGLQALDNALAAIHGSLLATLHEVL